MTVITILIFTFLLSATNSNGLVEEVYAWDDCPKGLVNDEYPGSCPLYVDTDGNGICDHSEPAPEDRIEYQNPADATKEKQSVAPSETTSDNNHIVLLSILVPLVIIIGYASIYKIKQKKTS